MTAPQAADDLAHLGALTKWAAARLDAFAFSVRGGTHLEWSYIPFISLATSYGRHQIGYYTLAWFDRWLSSSGAVRADALQRLLSGPIAQNIPVEAPWRANYMSARYLGGFRLTGAGGKVTQVLDLRKYGGTSPVGDWAGANADRKGRYMP